MSEGRLPKALVAALLLAALLVVPNAASGQQPPPSDERPEKPSVSSRLRALAEDDGGASSRTTRSGTRDLSASAGADIPRRSDGAPLVHVRVTDASAADDVIAGMEELDGVEVTHEAGTFLTAFVPADRLQNVDDLSGVDAVFESLAPLTRCGDALSEGDAIMNVDDARSTFGVDGTGVTVGVLSDSFDQSTSASTDAADDVASGDLPGTGSPCGSTDDVDVLSEFNDTNGSTPPNASDEGRAMAQIVHDLAPGASIAAGSAFNGLFEFADEIRNLRDAGASVIVDDIGYLASPFFQRGPIGEAVAEVAADGVTYVSAIGNDRNTDLGTDQTAYEADAYRPTSCSGLTLPPEWAGATCHDFVAGAGTDPSWDFTVPHLGGMNLDFQWSQPWLGVNADLDLLVFDMDGTFLGGAFDDNLATQVPFELLSIPPGSGSFQFQLAVVRYSGTSTPRFRWTHINSDLAASEYTSVTGPDTLGGGFAYGQPTEPEALGVGAAPYFDPTTPEPYSSRGPVTRYWGPVGDLSGPAAPIAPQVIAKPDVAAIDGVPTTFFGSPSSPFPRFFGTSAAAPHVAAVAALILEANPLLTPQQVSDMIRDTASPLANGDSTQWGAGLVQADGAVSAALDEGDVLTRFVPTEPERLLDTRDGTGYSGAKPGIGATVDFQVTGEAGVPDDGSVKAVALTVTATGSSGAGYVTAHPTGVFRPLAANLNLERKGQTISNQVIVALPPSGRVSLFTNRGTHLVADVAGYYEVVASSHAGRFVSIDPDRLLDTRDGTGYVGAKPADGAEIAVQAAGTGDVPADVTAVVLNVTATGTTAPGFVTAYEAGITRPTAAALTIERANQDIGTHVMVEVSPSGQFELYTSRSSHLVADIVGYYTADSALSSTSGLFVPITPTRLLDTRFGNGYPSGTKPAAGEQFTLQLAGRASVPAGIIGGAVVNLTIVGTAGPGYATLWPAGLPWPGTASVNTDKAGQTRPNLVSSGTSFTGAVSVLTSQSAHLVGDVSGYFLNDPS